MIKIALCQINTKIGDFKYNFEKIKNFITQAKGKNANFIIFQDNVLIGDNIPKVIEKFPFLIDENLKYLSKIADLSKGINILLPVRNKTANDIAFIKNGKISDFLSKNDIISIDNNIKCKLFLSKDIFNYEKKSDENFDIIINCAQNPSKGHSNQQLQSIFSSMSIKYNSPVIYVNAIGAGNEFVFDGNSAIFNNGKIINMAKSFEEDLIICDFPFKTNSVEIIPYQKQDKFSLNYELDLERTYNALILGIKDYFSKCNLKRAVLGLSGGLDSTVCAVLLADALGKENVYGISMPSKLTSNESKNDSTKLAQNLGINFTEKSIAPMVNVMDLELNDLFNSVEKSWDEKYTQSFVIDNIQARSRAIFLWGVSNAFKSSIPIATSDKSELYMGYATVNGDMSGGFAPIADITKTKLFALARWMNENRKIKNVIPNSVIEKPPGAELVINPKTGKPLTAEEALMPYEFMDEIIWRIENNSENYDKMLNSDFIYEIKHNISKDTKSAWLDKFFKRMSGALYKWTLLPPSIIAEKHSINKIEYIQPITSSNINYKTF